MKKFSVVVSLLIGMLLVVGGCTSDPIKDDIVKYTNAVAPIIKAAGGIEKKGEEIGKESNPKALVTKLRNELLPLVTDLKAKLEAVKPVTKEVQDIHNAYLVVIRDTEEGVKGLATAIEKQDQKLAKSSSDKLSAVGQGEQKFLKDIADLAQKHNVKLQ